MRFKARFAAALMLALLLAPDLALAANNQGCDAAASSQNECKGKRDKPKFQTKFFSE